MSLSSRTSHRQECFSLRGPNDCQQAWKTVSRRLGASRSIARLARDFDLSGAEGRVPKSGIGASGGDGSGGRGMITIGGGGTGGLSVGNTGGLFVDSCDCALIWPQHANEAVASSTSLAQE